MLRESIVSFIVLLTDPLYKCLTGHQEKKTKFILTIYKISTSSLIFTLYLNIQPILEEMFCLSDFWFLSLFYQNGLSVRGKR